MSKRAVRIGVLGILASVGGFIACGNQPDTGLVTTYASTSAANVSVDLRNGAGDHVGSCVGTLISSSAVLTAGHCVVNAKQWVITSGGQHPQTANGARVFTTWKNFDS
ncbi:MAG TPA: trypsin-like serine protease, partial [Polyangiaceae bacterium]